MSDPTHHDLPTLEASCQSFLEASLSPCPPRDAPREQVSFLRSAFFAGAMVTMTNFLNANSDLSEMEQRRFMARIKGEFDAFSREIIAEIDARK